MKPEILEPGERGNLFVTYDGSKRTEYGNVVDRLDVFIYQNNKETKGSVTVAANLMEDFEKYGPEFNEDPPKISFEQLIINIGEIDIRQSQKVTFKFRNTGGHDLILRSLKSTHGSSIVSYTKIVKPGENGTIIVNVSATLPTNNYQKNITVISNDPVKHTIQLRVKGKAVKNS